MTRYHLYSLATGLFSGGHIESRLDDIVQRNTPTGMGAMAGVRDWQSQRVALDTGQLVDYQPPPPSADYAWNPEATRWELPFTLIEARDARARALQQISALEVSQLRALREHALGAPGASDRLIAIDAAIAALRLDLH